MQLPPSEFLESREGGYYVTATRVSLESVAYALRRGEEIEEILADFPAITSRDNLAGVMQFVRDHTRDVDAYLTESEREWENSRKLNHPELVDKARRLPAVQGS